MHDLHRPATEHVARAHEHREADLVGDHQRLLEVGRGTARRLRDRQLGAEHVPALAVLGGVDRIRRRTRDELGRDLAGELQRCLPAERDDDPVRLLGGDHVEHVLARERLEVQPVARVVVGRHRLGVAVDHHRLVAGVAEREAGVHAAVVELDPLPDAVGPGSEDHHLASIGRADLGLVLVRRVVVRRRGSELGGARVDRLVGRHHAERLTGGADRQLVGVPQVRELRVGEPQPLGPADTRGCPCRRTRSRRAPTARR